jgi:hypothetical protein
VEYTLHAGGVVTSSQIGETPEEEHLARLSPLIHGHINMLGHYTFSLPEDILKGELRPLNLNTNNELTS